MDENLQFLLDHGMTLEEIHRLMEADKLPLEEIVGCAKRMIERGETLTSDLQGWKPPEPFDTVQTPAFPVDVLPGPVGDFVEALAESTQTPGEMAGILSLGILATAFQSKYELEITPDWREPLCLYTVAVAPPGERKSAVISALTAPVYEYEAEQRELEAAEIAQNQTERVLLEKALQTAQNSAVKGKGDFEAKRQEALDLSAQLAGFQELHPFRLIVDDTTPEKLVDMMELQGGSLTVSSAEGGIFDSIAGRYDRAANFDVYLKGHAGDTLSVDHIGRKSNHIAKPRLTMILTIQPSVLHGLMDNATFRGRGLCGRFLYAMCRSRVGRREVSPPPIPNGVKAGYRQFVRRILSAQEGGIVHLSPDADKIREEYQCYIEKKLVGELEHMQDWGNKLTGAMLRIAALFHLSNFPATEPISAETMAGATSIAEFLRSHALAAYQMMGSNEAQEDAKYLWRRMIAEKKDKVTRTELTRLCRGKFRKADDMAPALNELQEHGYIQKTEYEVGYNGRKQIAYLRWGTGAVSPAQQIAMALHHAAKRLGTHLFGGGNRRKVERRLTMYYLKHSGKKLFIDGSLDLYGTS